MMSDDNDGQMIFGDLGGLKLPDNCRTGEEKPRKNLTQETCPDRGSNPGPLRDRRACYFIPPDTQRWTRAVNDTYNIYWRYFAKQLCSIHGLKFVTAPFPGQSGIPTDSSLHLLSC